MPFGASPNVLAISPAQMLAAQDRKRQMAINYQISMQGLALRQQEIENARRGGRGGGRGGRTPTMGERAEARFQQTLAQQTIDRQLLQEQATRGTAASQAYYGGPSRLETLTPQSQQFQAMGLAGGPLMENIPLPSPVPRDYWTTAPEEVTSQEIVETISEASQQGVDATYTPEKGWTYKTAPPAKQTSFVGPITLEQRKAGYVAGYGKFGERILVKKKQEKPYRLSPREDAWMDSFELKAKLPEPGEEVNVKSTWLDKEEADSIKKDIPQYNKLQAKLGEPGVKLQELTRGLKKNVWRIVPKPVTGELEDLTQRVVPPQVEHLMPTPGGGVKRMKGEIHPGAVPGSERSVGGAENRIRVRHKTSGRTGSIPPEEFDPNIYEIIETGAR